MKGYYALRFLLASVILAGCSSHAPPTGRLADSIVTIAQLNEQLRQWYGTPHRYGGIDRGGVNCSGFVYRTYRDRFDISLPRSTEAQISLGTQVSRDELRPGNLVFLKPVVENGLYVGIYDTNHQFIHASTHHDVIRSSLNNVYWKRVYWQARRI